MHELNAHPLARCNCWPAHAMTTYSRRYDYFNLVQFLILLVVLIESIYVHKLVLWHKTRTAYRLDRTCLLSITLLYVLVLVVLFIMPFSPSGALTVAGILTPLLFTSSFVVFVALRRREVRVRQEALADLRTTPMSDVEGFQAALRHGFTAFDYDSNGTLDIDQLRSLLVAVYPSATKQLITKCLVSVKPIFSDDDTISFEGFEGAFESHIAAVLGNPNRVGRGATVRIGGPRISPVMVQPMSE